MIMNTDRIDEPDRRLYQELCSVMDSYQQVIELLCVYHSLKQAARLLIFSEKKLKELCLMLSSHHLEHALQDYRLKLVKECDKCNFSNKGRIVRLNDPEGCFIVYVARHITSARRAKRLERFNNTHFGRILGYPACCTDFYLKNSRLLPENHEPSIRTLWTLKQYPFVNNRFLRYTDNTILSHFPCNLECRESENLGFEIYRLIERYDQPKAHSLKREMSSLVIYTENDGILYTPDYSYSPDGTITYMNLQSTCENTDLADHFKRNKYIKAESINIFQAGDRRFEGGEVLLAMFR